MSFATTSTNSLHPLITQTLVETKKYYCPFLERGFCREGSRCSFSHERTSIKIPIDYCHFYIANQCLYGYDCKFRHAEPPMPSSSLTAPGQSSSNSSSFSFADAKSNSSYYPNSDYSHNSSHNHSERYYSNDEEDNDDDDDDDDEYIDDEDDYAEDKSDRDEEEDEEEEEEEEDDADEENHDDDGDDEEPPHKSNDPSTFYALMAIAGDMGNISAVSNHHDDDDQVHYAGAVDFEEGEYSGHCYQQQQLLICDLCEQDCLDPYDVEQQRQHREDCLREHEREMELSFAVQRSKDKVCGICMDTVVEKKPITCSRFGILEKCNHIFCLDCIRKWRGTKQFETRTIRACPECRTSSDFVIPSKYWVEDQNDKEKLIQDYKQALRSKPCKYFDEGRGECPFGGSCFYKHAYPDGRIAQLERPRRRKNYDRYPRAIANYILWNIFQSTDEDDWSNDDLMSLYLGTDYGFSDDDDDEHDDEDEEEEEDDDDDENDHVDHEDELEQEDEDEEPL